MNQVEVLKIGSWGLLRDRLRFSGFSLLELLVVLAIMGVLVAVMVPSFSQINQKAKIQAMTGTIHGIQLAVESYRLDTGHYPGTEIETISQLVDALKSGGYLQQIPDNPFTGQPYTDSDGSGRIAYVYDAQADLYHIQGYGQGNTQVVVDVSPQ